MDFIKYILFEGREQDFKFKYATKFTEDELENILGLTKTLNNSTKFLPFLGKTLESGFSEEVLENVKNSLKKFISISQNLSLKDINQYNTIEELYTALKVYEDKIRRNVKQVEGADIIYEDKKYVIVSPKTHKASCYYGAGTKWCTATTSSNTQFDNYMSESRLFYILDKTKPTSDIFYKVALLQKFDGERSFYDAPDNKFRLGWIFDTPTFDKLMLAVDNYMEDNYSDKIKIYKDENLKKLEIERIERQRLREIEQIRLTEAQQRREQNEWELSNLTTGDVGACAHAVFNILTFAYGIPERTVQDNVRLSELQKIQASLNTEYNDTNVDDDDAKEMIMVQLNLVAGVIDEIKNKIDVYNIIPIGEEYDMFKFLVIGSDRIGDTDEFIAGDADQTHTSAVLTLIELLDDVGIDAFNPSFLESHIDDDAIESLIKEYFETDVWDNPELYLDETEDRVLSQEQNDNIDDLKETIQELSLNLSSMTELLNSDKIEYGTDEFEELTTKISDVEDEIYNLEEKITEIESSPNGEYDEEKIEDTIESKFDYYTSYRENFFDDFMGSSLIEWAKENDAIDVDGVIDDAITTDGYGHTLNRNDGSEEITYVNEKLYYVMQIQ